jgi:ubiquinone/menaquinone biosynthesis C-methylase UbiE
MRKQLDETRARQLVARAAKSPLNNPFVEYPAWYLQRWHFLPEGYLSSRGAAGYDLLVRNLYNAFQERRVISALLGLLRHQSPRDVVELGCGPGRWLRAVAASGAARNTTGVDLSPYLLERAKANLSGHTNVELVHSGGHDLPWQSPEFDAAVAVHYFGHMPGTAQEGALSEAARVLNPGGMLYVVDHAWHPPLEHPELNCRYRRDRLMGLIRLTVFERQPARSPQFATTAEGAVA